MYQALYRKYRPRVFEDVVGQEHIVETLLHQVEEGKTAHAYLFTGSRGTGKTTCSKILAKAVNCLDPTGGDPCGECELCQGIDDGSVLDVVEIDAASWGGVDNIRQLREEAGFTPVKAKYRVYIIDECHMLSVGAFNALLKIMEEPPPHVLFILATTEVHKVPPTILSRCQRFDFRRIPSQVIAARLQNVAEKEGISLTMEGALLIARLADGGMRDALSILDLCASFSQEVDDAVVTQAVGLVDNDRITELCGAVCRHDCAQAFLLLDQLHSGSTDFERVCDQLIATLRNVMMVKAAPQMRDLVAVSKEQYARLEAIAKEVEMEELLAMLEVLQGALGRLSRGGNKRTEVEMALVRAALRKPSTTGPMGSSPSEAEESGRFFDLSRRLDRLEAALDEVGKAPPNPASSRPVPAPRREAPAEANVNLEQMEALECWEAVLSRLLKINPALHGALQNSKAYTKGDIVLIDAPDELFVKLIRQSEYTKESLRDALKAQTGKKYRLGPYKRPAQEEAAEDPLRQLEEAAKDAGIDVSVTGR